ncbi:SDR family oxidoreductase [Streptomyces sp. NBC_01622]|uniref:SDR family oxidoreductase n=1 Tax=Streptomyces sp. NBC_01622 TaxID=2975903 RepID=UPI00386EBC69|nr:SDR family oxidoreductase [Streptomyces sp. NBC_01622]
MPRQVDVRELTGSRQSALFACAHRGLVRTTPAPHAEPPTTEERHGHYASLSPEGEAALATAPAAELLSLPAVTAVGDDSLRAYMVAKRANHVRVEAAALAWNLRGARINTVSPGVVSTVMSKAEAESPHGGHMLKMLDDCGAGRAGTPGEIADAVAFLTGPQTQFITGTDLLVDGGQAAWVRRHMRH